MDQSALRKLLEQVRDSQLSPEDAITRLRHLPFEDLGFAKIDHHRPPCPPYDYQKPSGGQSELIGHCDV